MSAARVRAISDEALVLARRAAAGTPAEDDTRRAAQLARELGDLRPVVDAASGHDADGLRVAFSEGFVDLDWVLSGGSTPLSIRMTVIGRGGDPSGA